MSYSTFNSIKIKGISSSVPKNRLTFKKFEKNNGDINEYCIHKSIKFQTTSDLGYTAAKYLLNKKDIDIDEIGVLIFVSKTPDYRGPATATVLHGRLNLSSDCIAYDVNMGSSGFVYGSQIVCSHLESINKKYGFLIVGDTATKQISESKNIDMLFGDGASAILFERIIDANPIHVSTKAYGDKYESYAIEEGGFRINETNSFDKKYNNKTIENNFLKINKKDFLKFIDQEILRSISVFLERFNLKEKDYDTLALHQLGNITIYDLSKKLEIIFNYLPINFNKYGNTCGNSIPLLLADTYGNINNEIVKIFACSYGEGFSLGVMDFSINSNDIFEVIESDEYYKDGFIVHEM